MDSENIHTWLHAMKAAGFGVLLLLPMLAACTQTPVPDPAPALTAAAQPAAASASVPDFLLPAPVYFLQNSQIWLLDRDGQSVQQITRESTTVESFDASRIDGKLVYVTGNVLVLTDALGGSRQVLLEGPALPAREDELARLNSRDYITGSISSPVWSPDGRMIAFIQDGLNLLTVSDGSKESIHPNDVIPEEGETSDRLIYETIHSWSPDGQHLLVGIYHYPLESVFQRMTAVKARTGYLRTIGSCTGCSSAWQADSQVFYLADPAFGGRDALRRCVSEDGQCTLIGQEVPARAAYFYAYPWVLSSGELFVFMADAPDPAQPPELFRAYRMNASGMATQALREDEASLQTALWAQDGSGVLIVSGAAVGEAQPDRLEWLPADGGAAVPIPVSGAHLLRWGLEY